MTKHLLKQATKQLRQFSTQRHSYGMLMAIAGVAQGHPESDWLQTVLDEVLRPLEERPLATAFGMT
ncbi:hypothetical protein CGLO_06235 [Colletotrichum gloeosporioides Cg-14]|uniref:Uncharacterized protein n=1 Tax=Colletotrichum gloeosporioides (strain Cg-14) TaxID=1237896 RepID=T0LQP3_COLGC|nr:hypothetical protein CGLO_06235 [Colletotrichum gloeosporioides Cg-14]